MKKNAKPHRPAWAPQDELGTHFTPAAEIYLEIVLDIMNLQKKISESQQRLIQCGEDRLSASEVTEPMEHLDRAFHEAWETLGVRLDVEFTCTIAKQD